MNASEFDLYCMFCKCRPNRSVSSTRSELWRPWHYPRLYDDFIRNLHIFQGRNGRGVVFVRRSCLLCVRAAKLFIELLEGTEVVWWQHLFSQEKQLEEDCAEEVRPLHAFISADANRYLLVRWMSVVLSMLCIKSLFEAPTSRHMPCNLNLFCLNVSCLYAWTELYVIRYSLNRLKHRSCFNFGRSCIWVAFLYVLLHICTLKIKFERCSRGHRWWCCAKHWHCFNRWMCQSLLMACRRVHEYSVGLCSSLAYLEKFWIRRKSFSIM